MRTAVLLDFDGTITVRDSSELALRRFAQGRWEEYDEMLDHGEIGLEKYMKRQFSLVKAMPEEISDYLDGEVEVRDGFVSLFDVLSRKACHVGVVSAGLNFFINHLMRKTLDMKDLEITSGRAIWKDGFVHFSFPAIRNEGALDFKQDTVIEVKKGCGPVISGMVARIIIRQGRAILYMLWKGRDWPCSARRNYCLIELFPLSTR